MCVCVCVCLHTCIMCRCVDYNKYMHVCSVMHFTCFKFCSPPEYIQAIMGMREEVQHTVMAAIQDVSVGQRR